MIHSRKKIIVDKINPYLTTFFSLSTVLFVFGLLLFCFTYLWPSAKIVKAEEIKWVPPTGQAIMELHIANNGMILLRGAKVVSISDSDIIVSTTWNITAIKWVIHTNESYYDKRHFGTSFLDTRGHVLSIDSISVGDTLTISGMLETQYSDLFIIADVIRIIH